MSLFQDDFYSTRVSRWRTRVPGGRSARDQNRLFWVVVGSVLGGMVLMLLLLTAAGGIRWSGEGEETADAGGSLGKDVAYGGTMYQEELKLAAVAKVKPTVVTVVSSFDDKKAETSVALGIGSGILFEKDDGRARLVTNNHVVEGANSYEVVLSNGVRKKAAVIGMDRYTDLAVLEVDASGIEDYAEFGDSDKLRSGETAIAIGNPLGINYSQTVTVGVISSPKVTFPVLLGQFGETEWEMDVIHTDAAINQGNSGGALVNLEGKVVGINSMKVTEKGVEGFGFAIPINEAGPVIEQLIEKGKILRPFIGVETVDLQGFDGIHDVVELPEGVKSGALILGTSGPAKKAGLKLNDVIVQLDHTPINGTLSLRKFLYREKKIGDDLKITYYRDGKKETVTLVLEELK